MADNTILINEYLQRLLEANVELKTVLGNEANKIFPLQQPQELQFPFIVYQRNITVEYTKPVPTYGYWDNTVQFEIACVSNDYVQSLDVANACRHAIEGYGWDDAKIKIHPIRILTINESTIDSDSGTVFVQSILAETKAE